MHAASTLLLMAVAAATAQPALPPVQIFISPAGEPFRAAPGEPYPVADWFRAADSDHDGRLSQAEFLADAKRWFDGLDLNRNGQLEASEIDAYETDVLAPLARPRGGPPGRGRRAPDFPPGAAAYGLIAIPHPVKAADRDLNSKVTADEWERTMIDRYSRLEGGLDGTGQGPLALATLPRTFVQQMEGKPR
jgi:hypothetical protein